MMTPMYQSDQLNQMNRSQLMHFIDMVSFQVVDTHLFLDTHPSDKEALEHFKYYSELCKKAKKLYSEKYAPLTIDTADPECYWDWVKEPWPWEGGMC